MDLSILSFKTTLIFILLSYLSGSIPFGLILAKWMGHGDLRDIGSGNIGTTNALRTGSKKLAIFTLLGDVLKAVIPVLIAKILSFELALIAAFAAIIGHIFPIWLNFKGGKGIATTLGAYFALSFPVALLLLITWMLTAMITRYSSLAALVAVGLSPLFCFFFGNGALMLFSIIIGGLIYYKHKGNIRNLVAGKESKIKLKK